MSACGDDDGETGTSTATAGPGTAGGAEVVHEFVPLDAGGPLTKQALADGEIDIGVLFTSSADEAANDFVQLEDDQGLQPAENFVPAIGPDIGDVPFTATLNAVSAELTTEAVQAAVSSVAEGALVADVAAGFLAEAGLPGAVESPGGELFTLTVGSASFPESEIVGEIYTQALLGAGIEAMHRPGLGFREVYFPALESGDLDVVPEFVGSLLTHLGGEPTSDLDGTLADLRAAAEERGVSILTPAPAQSQNGFYASAANADQLGLVTLSDLADADRPLVVGGPAECPERPLCLVGLQETYGLEFDV